jgi:HSP20 family protein
MAIITIREPAYFAPGFGLGRGGRNLGGFQNEMNRLFESFFGRSTTVSSGVFPPVNVYQTADALIVTAELPGIKAEEIQIDVEDDSLLLHGERRVEHHDGQVSYHRRERDSGSFSRKIAFGQRIDAQRVSADLKDGILTVTLPRARETMPHKVQIKTS